MQSDAEPTLEQIAFLTNMIQLRRTSFQVILIMIGVVGWVWFSWSVWPKDRRDTLTYPQAWPISALLLLLAVFSFGLMRRHAYSAMILFVLGLLAAISTALRVFSAAELVNGFDHGRHGSGRGELGDAVPEIEYMAMPGFWLAKG